jgi:hypothetical protein
MSVRSRLLAGVLSVPLLAPAACSGGGSSTGAGPGGGRGGFSAPAVAALPADYVGSGTGLTQLDALGATRIRRFAGGRAEIRGPHFAYVFGSSGVATTLSAAQAKLVGITGAAVAAPGHELVLVATPLANNTESQVFEGRADRIEIVVNGRARPFAFEGPPMLWHGVVVASVPTGAHPILRITDAGRPQSLDLVTGRRGPDAITGYYPIRSGSGDVDPDHSGPWVRLSGPGAAGLTGESRLASIYVSDVDYTLWPWLPNHGWAGAGRLWLDLDVKMSYWRPSAGADGADTVRIAPSSFRLAGPAGTVTLTGGSIAPAQDTPLTAPGQAATGTFRARIPETLRAATLTFHFAGTIATENGTTTWTNYDGGSGTVPIAFT